MVRFWEVSERGKRGPTIDHLHMSGNQWREGVDHDKGIEEGVHIGID